MELSVLYGFTIFLLTISLMKHVCAAAIDIPLISKLNAPLKVELDISILTTQLKELIANEVKQAVSEAMKDLAENIVDNKTQSAVENLQTFNNLTISTLLKEIEDVIARKNDVRIMEENLKKSIEQQKITESKLSSVEAQLKSSTKRVALTAFVSAQLSLSVGSVVKFSDVKFSEGISDLSTFKSTGKFKCGKNGLYIVSVTIEFDINGSEFYIYVNGKVFTRNYKLQRSNWWHSSTAVIAIELNTNDTVWVQIGSQSTSVREDLHSRFTIIKIH